MKKMPYIDFFKDKIVTLMGLGLLGRGVGDAAFLARHCRKLYVTDMKNAEDLRASIEQLKSFDNIEFILGGHEERLFTTVDFVVKGAGVRLDNPYIRAAEQADVPVYMSTALFAHLSGLKSVGVTGTRGKTTTTCMIAHILQRAGRKALLGGNLRGLSTLALLPDAGRYDLAVLELDSWQLQGFAALGISPNVAVFTNFYPDHMNYYDGDMDRYRDDKAGIFLHQHPGDHLVMSAQAAAAFGDATPARAQIAEALPESVQLQIPGAHNRANAALARAAALALGIDEAVIDAALRDFTAVEGRLQQIGAWQGRVFFNDSNATTQEATLAALTSFAPDTVVLIFGGADKELPIDALTGYLARHDVRAVLIKGTGSDRVLAALPDLPVASSMAEAVRLATGRSRPGDAIVLSPGFASFGVFKNEYDRSDQFLREVARLTAPSP